MKLLILTCLLLRMAVAHAQFGPTNSPRIDSVRHLLALARHDTSRVLIMVTLCDLYRSTDSAQFFGQQALKLAQKINFRGGKIRAMTLLSRIYTEEGNLPKGFQLQLIALQIAEANQMEIESGLVFNQMGNLYATLENFSKSKTYYKRALAIFNKQHDSVAASTEKMQLGRAFEDLNQLDSALYYENQAYKEMLLRRKNSMLVNPLVYRNLGRIYSKLGNHALAFKYAHQSLIVSKYVGFPFGYAYTLTDLALFFKRINRTDSSLYYANRSLEEGQRISNQRIILQASRLLSELYESIDTKEAFRYYKLATATKDSLFGSGAIQAIQQMLAQEAQRKKEREAQQLAYQNQLRQYALFVILGVSLLIGFVLYRNYRQQKRANALLSRQKEEITYQRQKAESTLAELRTTQTQLIQREKMASLGELTAGIAHEIQNPLNFVNNFSDVSVELVEEQQQALAKGDLEEVSLLATDLRENLQRITQNGQRASNIVRGMLEHSRSSTGERQPTDLNALCDEYLRLAYQGVRAKDSSIACQLETHFDPDLPLVSVVASDISRVLLNLFNNAFYAVGQKQKTAPPDYQPTVTVSTAQTNGRVEIRVRDNGMGIPEAIKEKIFQPFFTTKPTGEGTGLGLSLSYDIVTKGHGGEMRVESQENVYTEFVVTLPVLPKS